MTWGEQITNGLTIAIVAVTLLGLGLGSAHADLISWWDFNVGNAAAGAGGVKDLATANGSHDGTAFGTYTFSSDVPAALAGANSRSADLSNANSYIMIDTHSGGASENDFDMGTSLTVAFWLKGWPTSVWAPLIHKSNMSNQGWQVLKWNTLTTSGFATYAATQFSTTGPAWGSSPTVWKHCAVTYDGANVRFYTDGALTSGPTAYTHVPANHTGNIAIANRSAGGYISTIQVDDIGIWNEALSPAAIASLAAGYPAVLPPPRRTVFIVR